MKLNSSQQTVPKIHYLSFWIIYTALAIWAAAILPGLDPFAPALIFCLSSEPNAHPRTNHWWIHPWGVKSWWLIVLWILVAEGSGGFNFGVILLSYTGLSIFYFWLVKHLNAMNIVFLFTISMTYGLLYFLVRTLMADLQPVICAQQTLLYSALLNTLSFPCILLLISHAKNKWVT